MAEQEQVLANAEPRYLTIVFCDLVSSTELSKKLDPEDFGLVIAKYHAVCTRVIERFHGHIAQYQGDGVLAYFGYPRARGDDTVQAVRAGLALVRAVKDVSGAHFEGDEVRLAARVGIDTGVVVVSDTGPGALRQSLAFGDTVNIAARLEKLAEPGTVVVSEATARVTRGYFSFIRTEAVRVKGVTEPIDVHTVESETGIRTRLALAASDGLTPLVGRDRELEELERNWRLACDGEGRALLISGEPGIGKSRVVDELGRRVAENGIRYVFQASPYHTTSALHPVVDELERVLGAEGESGGGFPRLLEALDMRGIPTGTGQALASLLSLDDVSQSPPELAPQERKRQSFDAIRAVIAAETTRLPVLAVFEDVHWADPSTLELLGLLLHDAAALRIFVVMTARPEFVPHWPPMTAFSRLALSRLERQEVDDFMTAVLRGRELSRAVLEQVADRAAGVPLFIEETLKMIFEGERAAEQTIPGTLRNPLAARLDALGDAKELAQVASVAALGGEFGVDLLQAVTELEEATLRDSLQELLEAELLQERGLPSQRSYVFRHALIRDAAYRSLLRSARRGFHGRIADVLVEGFPERVEHEPELVAQHLAEAGRSEEAIGFWQRAGERALRAWATEEAATHFERGLTLVASLPDSSKAREFELGLLLARGTALMALRGYASPESAAVYARAEALSREVNDPVRLAPALYGLSAYYAASAQPRKACEFGQRLAEVAEFVGDEDTLIEANVILAIAEYLKGDPLAAEANADQARGRWEPGRYRHHIFVYGQEPGVIAMTMLALTRGWQGRLDEALAVAEEAEQRGREAGHPLTLAYAYAANGLLYHLVGDVDRLERTAARLLAVTSEHGLPMWGAWGRIMRGWALLQRDEAAEGLAEINVGLAEAEAVQFTVMKIHFLGQLAQVFGGLGRSDEAFRMIDEAIAALEATGERVSEAELYRSRGILLAETGQPSAGEDSLRQAINVARGQHALLLELRATTTLASLIADDRPAEARTLLSDVMARLTQGAGTPVFREAAAGLSSLRDDATTSASAVAHRRDQ
jgi:class 3 adenylate cyclase/tetratricopeptide (TPR) repeat protein